ARHVQTQQQQQDAARDAEGGERNAEELQQAQAGEEEEAEEDHGEQADHGRDADPLTQGGTRRGRREDRHIADGVQQGEQRHEQVDPQIDRVHCSIPPLKPAARPRLLAHLSGHPRAPASRREPEMSADRPNRPFDPRVICALDVPTTDEARALVERIGDAVGFYKVGLQLFASDGMALARELKASGAQVFLDWKLHDIGVTVEKATAVLANAGCDLLTVHARPQVMAAAARGAAGSDLKILGVTVLTSLTDADLRA